MSPGRIFSNIPCKSKTICSMPMPVNIMGTALCSRASSTRRCSNSPVARMARIFSRVLRTARANPGCPGVESKAGG